MTKNTMPRVLVIGGGAGGLAAAVAAAGAGAEVTILEKANRVGKKLLKTGNGRCNLSNRGVAPEGYNHPDFVAPLLARTGCEELLSFFASLGLWTVSDAEGRVYPRSDTAASVLDVLRLAAAERGAREVCSCEVTAIRPRKSGGYAVSTRENGELGADRVIVATGGGTALLRPLGCALVPFSPALCPLRTEVGPIRALTGLRVKCRAVLWREGREIYSERGEILFRDFGVSGILALDLSRYAQGGDALILDLLPEFSEEQAGALLRERQALGRAPGEILTGVFHRRINEAILRAAGSTDAAALARAAKSYRLTVLGPGDVQSAQVTRGGAAVGEFDPLTLQSQSHPGLYCVGEALDIDARCGGYNLHWAFASGLAAGRSAAE